MEHHLQANVTVLALVNPAMCVAIFLGSAGALPRVRQLSSATTAAVTVLVILVLAALFGTKALHAFGVSLDVFSVAGGAVLAWIGLGIIRESNRADQHDNGFNPGESQAVLTPLVLFAASLDAVAGVITLAAAPSTLGLPATALMAVAAATAVMWLVLVVTIQFGSCRGNSADAVGNKQAAFVRDTITRFMGLIVIAMGVQFVLTGLQSFFSQYGA